MSKSLSGNLLVSIPALTDPNFFRTVVLLFQHSESGAAGVVINRRTNAKISDIGSEFTNDSVDNEQHVYVGGPVEGPVMALHTRLAFAELPIIPGLFLSTQKTNLLQIAAQPKQACKFFVNYSGWGAGQLENEIKAGGWLVTPASVEDVLQIDEVKLWRSLCEKIGCEVMLANTPTLKMPLDPSDN